MIKVKIDYSLQLLDLKKNEMDNNYFKVTPLSFSINLMSPLSIYTYTRTYVYYLTTPKEKKSY